MKQVTIFFVIFIVQQVSSVPCPCSSLTVDTECAKNPVCEWDTTCKEKPCDQITTEDPCNGRKDCYFSSSGCASKPATCDGYSFQTASAEAHAERCYYAGCEPNFDFQTCGEQNCSQYQGLFASACLSLPFCYQDGVNCALITDCSTQFANDQALCEAQQPFCISFGTSCLNGKDFSCEDIPIEDDCNHQNMMPLKGQLCQWGTKCEGLSFYSTCDQFTVLARCEKAKRACEWVDQKCQDKDLSTLTVDTCYTGSGFEAFLDGSECKLCKDAEFKQYEQKMMMQNMAEEEDDDDQDHAIQLSIWFLSIIGIISFF